MRKQTLCMAVFLLIIGLRPVMAIDAVEQYVPHAEKVGEARMSLMLWDIYDAVLLAPEGEWRGDKPFALKLTYLRHLDGDKIADRAVKEIRGLGFDDEVKLATWHTQMRQIFPDVDNGDTLTGIFTDDKETIFFDGNTEIGRIKDYRFTKFFPAIWLSPNTSDSNMRLGLLGQETMKGHNNYETFERTGSHGTAGLH